MADIGGISYGNDNSEGPSMDHVISSLGDGGVESLALEKRIHYDEDEDDTAQETGSESCCGSGGGVSASSEISSLVEQRYPNSSKEIDVDELEESMRLSDQSGRQCGDHGINDPKPQSAATSSSSVAAEPGPTLTQGVPTTTTGTADRPKAGQPQQSSSPSSSSSRQSGSSEKDNTATLGAVSVAIRRSREEQQTGSNWIRPAHQQSTTTTAPASNSTEKDNVETLQAVSVGMRLSEEALRLPGAVHVHVDVDEEDLEAPAVSNHRIVDDPQDNREGNGSSQESQGSSSSVSSGSNSHGSGVVMTPGEQQVFHPAELVTAAEMHYVEATPLPTLTTSSEDSSTADLYGDHPHRHRPNRRRLSNERNNNHKYRAVRLCLLVITAILAVGVCVLTPLYLQEDKKKDQTTQPPTPLHCVQPEVKRPPFLEPPDLDPYVRDDIKDPCTPQAWANEWMWDDPHLENYTIARRIQRFMAVSSFLKTGGENYWFRKDHWLSYDVPECQWFYKHPNKDEICDDNDVLRILNLTDNGLHGEVTTEMLIYLRTKVVDCSHNNLYGTIPKATQEVGVVEYLDFSYNNLEGDFALEVGVREVSVKVLKIQNNNFGGTLPPDVALMPNLTHIDASNNQFEDRFPLSVGFLKKLEVIRAANNKLYGTIPTGIGLVPKLRELDISGNVRIEGPLPSELANIDTLEILDVRNTSIRGPIPSRLCEKASSGRLDLWVSGCGTNGWEDCCPS